ncbi:6-hydroxymethylpterin diphosphokinase MptE-like protein [Treponema brennaborense]|uniref:6-hydroxymethylpterin diphosphokinase MptE-like domain-containing protein n=1 Tax=Treponema brennaborense (strain DSM 12168 / CIP 105900 / DD5/3) TaxID=906968 RepID=F4LQH7_TREBD|nr:6-hydroxymethylpterin diphosphokinase MptE-like protein [Treponema brennaborense]AEE17186.1 protein of unknown function DUF115 [Treponema brennaborense DSM 12168]
MNSADIRDEPCLVQTGRGLSVLYGNRYLYSRYDPAAAAERLADSVQLREDTLILCFSPILGYGLQTLAAKLRQNCRICVVEADPLLFKLYECASYPKGTLVVAPKDVPRLPQILERRNAADSFGNLFPPPGTFRRCLRLDFSAAPALREQTYRQIHQAADGAIASFWKNRLTLIRMGRTYHRNLFRNLGLLPSSKPFAAGSVGKPIVVAGAGPSADGVLDAIAALPPDTRNRLYIIAVDAALGALLGRRLVPDAAATVECQFAIQKAYYGAAGKRIPLFADMTSRSAAVRPATHPANGESGSGSTGGPVVFFSSAFADTGFLDTLRAAKLLPQAVPPLGSVGLAATEIALMLRADISVPVFVTGLDFAFPPGKTHCRGTPQLQTVLIEQNRLSPCGNPAAAYRNGVSAVSKRAGNVVTDRALAGYGALFADRYGTVPNLFDLACIGLPLGLPVRTIGDFVSFTAALPDSPAHAAAGGSGDDTGSDAAACRQAVLDFYDKEETALEKLKSYLVRGGATDAQLRELLLNREYLYLHFPDGFKPSTDVPFLKRVRAEIDFFLKDIRSGRKNVRAGTRPETEN